MRRRRTQAEAPRDAGSSDRSDGRRGRGRRQRARKSQQTATRRYRSTRCRPTLITGAGRAFCAGQDLTAIVGMAPAEIGHLLDHYNPLIAKLRALRVPVVCAVNGVAAGAGANLALACDIVLAGEGASFVQAFARIGLIPDCGGTWFLPRLVGMARARALSMQ